MDEPDLTKNVVLVSVLGEANVDNVSSDDRGKSIEVARGKFKLMSGFLEVVVLFLLVSWG